MKIPSLRHFFVAVALVSIAALAAPLWGDAAQPIRVVCIGDSITQGRGDHSKSGNAWLPTDGWRYDFWKLSIDNNVPIQFVGTEKEGFESTPTYADYKGQTFNNLHEAHWGWTTEAVFNKLKETQSQWTADVALVYLGTNKEKLDDAEKASDPDAIARTTAAMRGIILLLQQNNPKISICIRELLGSDARSKGLNESYEKLATELSTSTSKIVTVPVPVDWQWDPKKPNTDTIDGCHSSKSGDQKIADGFWTAFSSLNK
jgi:lysophospholipase L1-like esterase